MQRNGMNAAQLDAFHAALQAPVRIRRTRILVMDLDHNVQRDVVLHMLDGQVAVNVDVEASGETTETTRQLTMTVADPTGSLGLDPTSVGEYSVFPQMMIQVRYGLKVDDWRDTAVHTGPLLTVTPGEGGAVEIAAQGKEALAAGSQRQRSWKAGTPKTDIIVDLIVGTGEKRAYIEVPDLPRRKAPKRVVLLETDNPWRKARALAKSMGYVLFYDGRGVAVMRKPRTSGAVFTFDREMVLGDLQPSQETKPIYNTFIVTGGKPKGSKKRVTSGRPLIQLDPDHEWSPRNLGRGGEPRLLVQRETNDQFMRQIDCRFRAFQLRAAAVRLTTEIPAEVVCAPHLDELDRVRVIAANGARIINLRQFTIPLADQSQALGTVVRTGNAFVPPKPKKPPKKKAKAKGKRAGKKAAARPRRPGGGRPGRNGGGRG